MQPRFIELLKDFAKENADLIQNARSQIEKYHRDYTQEIELQNKKCYAELILNSNFPDIEKYAASINSLKSTPKKSNFEIIQEKIPRFSASKLGKSWSYIERQIYDRAFNDFIVLDQETEKELCSEFKEMR